MWRFPPQNRISYRCGYYLDPYLLSPWSRVILGKLTGLQLVTKFPDSLEHSQVPATCPYPEPAQSSPYLHIPLPQDPSHILHLCLGLPSGLFPSDFPTKTLSLPPYALHAPPISFFLILSLIQNSVSSTDH